MCLYTDWKATKEYKKNNKGQFVVNYKVLHHKYGRLFSEYYEQVEWLPGFKVSNRIPIFSTLFEIFIDWKFTNIHPSIHKCIHVYTSRERAEEECIMSYETIVPVNCHTNDLVAIGESNEAVFKTVYLSDKEYRNIVEKDKV